MSVSVSQYSLLCAYVFVCCVGVSVWLWQERSDCTSSRELLVSKCRASLSLSLSFSVYLSLVSDNVSVLWFRNSSVVRALLF
jgi:uncharacterized membrane protein